MKKIHIISLILISSQIVANNGDITFINLNNKFDNDDTISVQIIPSNPDNNYFFVKELITGNPKTISSDQFQASKKFSIFIADINQSFTYHKCLSDIEYDPNSKPITIAVVNTGHYNQCYCIIEGYQNPCTYPTNEYNKTWGQTDIPW